MAPTAHREMEMRNSVVQRVSSTASHVELKPPVDFDDHPPQAFDTGSERESVAARFERFNRLQLASQDSASATIGKQSDDEESHAAMTPDIDAGFVTLNLDSHARTHRAALCGGIFPSLSVLGGIAISSFFGAS